MVRVISNSLLIYTGVIFFSIILALSVIFLLMYDVREPLYESVGVIKWIHQHQAEDPIETLRETKDGKCNETDFEPMPFGVYPGTIAGHYCSSEFAVKAENATTEEEKVEPLSCKFITCHECTNVNPFPQTNIMIWKGMRLCAKYITKWQFASNSSACPSSMNFCPQSEICVDKAFKCPITNITILPENSPTKAAQQGFEIVASIAVVFDTQEVGTIGELRALAVSRTQPGNPVSALSVSLEKVPCLSSAMDHKRGNSSEGYPLSTKKEEGCGKYGLDEKAYQVDKAEEFAVYQLNNFYNNISTNNPVYKKHLSETKLILSARKHSTLNTKNASAGCVIISTKRLSDLETIAGGLDTMRGVAHTAAVLFLMISSMYVFYNVGVFFFFRQKLSGNAFLFRCNMVMSNLVAIPAAVVTFILLKSEDKTVDPLIIFGYLKGMDCFELPKANKALEDLTDPDTVESITLIFFMCRLVFIASLLYIFICLLFFLLREYHKKPKQPHEIEHHDEH